MAEGDANKIQRSIFASTVLLLLMIAGTFGALYLQGQNADEDRALLREQQQTLATILVPAPLSVQSINVLNRIDGVAGPAVEQHGLLRWTLFVCNPRPAVVSSTIGASLVNVESGETISFAGNVSADLPPNPPLTNHCAESIPTPLAIRMDKDVPPGKWRLRLVIFFQGVSDSIFGLSEPLEVVMEQPLTVLPE